jgi:4-amino-4-deoxy-L-arabinose transferase-like glycosyltransferase
MKKLITEKPLLFILLFAFLIRLVYFIAIAILNPDGFYMYDSYGYWQLAYNIKEYGIFSQGYDLPLEPDYYRTPVYPLFILIAESIKIETLPIIFIQILLSTCSCYLTYKIANLLSLNKFIACTAALIVAVDIPGIVMSTIVMTEILFTFLLLCCIFYFLKYLKTEQLKSLIISAILCGITILCRPIGFFLPFFFVFFILLKFRKQKKYIFRAAITYCMVTFLTLSPWFIRNKITFNHYFLSVIREHDMQNYQAAAIYAEQHNLSLATAQSTLRWKTFKAFSGDANKQPYEYAKFIEADAINIVFSNPTLLLKHHAIQFIHFFLKPCRAYIDIQLGNWGVGYNTIPKDYPIFEYLFKHNSKLTISIVFCQLGLMLPVYCGVFISFFYFRKNKQLFYFLLLGLLIFCFANLTLPYVTESRFRIPVIPYIAILGAAGIYRIKEKFKKKRIN